MNVFLKRCAVGFAAAAASVATLLGAAGPAGAESAAIQVEAVTSDTPVMVSDLESNGVTADLYCAVRDNTFGCQSGTPGDGLVVARLYDGTNYTGQQVVIFNPAYHVGCTSGTGDNEGGANLGDFANKASSVHTYNSCDIKLFDGYNAGPPSTGWIDHSSWSNRANSFKIS
jgi:hypothetical protein